MIAQPHDLTRLLEIIAAHISVPKSYYEKAAARHRSLGEWLCRPESTIRIFNPDIRPQGSFRHGTVNRPLDPDDEYDLDNVCVLQEVDKSTLTQEQVKVLYGSEIRAYARANGMINPVTEHHRCWRLPYADEVRFHLDTLPCVPEEKEFIDRLVESGVPWELARRAVAITDRRHPHYRAIMRLWPSSNPRGFAVWFQQQAAVGRARSLAIGQMRATVEDVPPYEWKTTLQLSIQLLKRHRDVMFRSQPDLAPISMVITNLAAHAYDGEPDLAPALVAIVEKMPEHVRRVRPRVPNPADPAEDYAEKWAQDPRLAKSFWDWHTAVKADIKRLKLLSGGPTLPSEVRSLFSVTLTQDEERELGCGAVRRAPAIVPAALILPSAPKPWGNK